MKYSLADYILTVTVPDKLSALLGFKTINVGGEGSYLDSIKFSNTSDMWSTKGDATGGWVHNKNLDLSGKCDVTLNQLHDSVARFKRVVSIYYSSSTEMQGLTLTLKDRNGGVIVTGIDCLITKTTDQEFSSEAATQTWSFTCGRIVYTNN